MRWRTAAATTLLACWTLASPAAAQVAAPEAEILRQVAQTYRTLGTYLFEGGLHVVVQGSGAPQIQDVSFFAAAGPGGRLRDQITSPAMGGMVLSDGKQTIVYNAALGQYTRRPGRVDSVLARVSDRGVVGTLITRYSAIADGATTAKRLPDAALTLEGAERDCYVLEVGYPPTTGNAQIQELPRTYWIEKRTHLLLRQRTVVRADLPQYGGKVEQQEEVTLRRAMLDPALPDSLWVFRPPAGSREVAEFTTGGRGPETANPFAGKPAIDFTLKDLNGRAHSLKSLRGKVVLLDFWATWCGPCRVTMPQVAKIHAEYKNRGVEVMSINVGESATKAGAYVKKNGYLFTTLLDQDHRVSSQYRVNGIPTLVVIDRAGTVSDYLVGVRDDVALRAALKKAGVK
jgi:thiol-disulfide isomerase/thioredoxin/outer membrane lipoprotein-sorting protein